MSAPAYGNYQGSGVGWLGEVPTHWQLRRLGYYFDERREKVSDKDYPPLSVTKSGIVPQLETAAKTDDGDNRKKVIAGDFVINSRSDRKGSSGIAEQDGSVSLINTVLTPLEDVRPKFVHYLLRSTAFQEEYYRYGKGIVADLWSTNYSDMKAITLAVPPLPEQTAIAAFLDRETAKIDALVEEQKRLIELLKEKRQAVISHAVTRGLNPDATMKDSGIEWLGEVPEHWEVVKGSKLGDLFGSEPVDEASISEGGDTLFLKVASVAVEGFALDGPVWYLAELASSPRKNFVVFPKRGAAILSNKVGIVNENAVLDPNLMGWQIQAPNSLSFYAYVLKTRRLETLADVSTVPQINNKHVGPERFPVPPPDEQAEIASELDAKMKEFDELRDAVERSLHLLQERRSALISAAVTGKIDVRGISEVEDAA